MLEYEPSRSAPLPPLLLALTAYAETLVDGARVLVIAPPEVDFLPRLSELGARHVRVHDPAYPLDLREGPFDVALVADTAASGDMPTFAADLRRALHPRGVVVALAHAAVDGQHEASGFDEVSPAVIGYSQLYDVFATTFPHVTMTGVVAFAGIVFARLGEEEAAVGVDASLTDAKSPSLFVVVASGVPVDLDPYTIVEVDGLGEAPSSQADDGAAIALEVEGRAQQITGELSRRLVLAERAVLDREDQVAALRSELSGARADLLTLRGRYENSEAELALHVADLAMVVEAHASETAALESQLVERATYISELEGEIARRERFVRELIGTIEEAREGVVDVRFEPVARDAAIDETAHLRHKLDQMALEIARREGELVAQGWRIAELEQSRASSPPPHRESAESADQARLEDELTALRQALAQEHAARVAAESRAP